jgi:hypothetical protein
MDIFIPKKTYILFLPNIFPEDCQDDEDVLRDIEDVEEFTESDNSSVVSDDDIPDLFNLSPSFNAEQNHSMVKEEELKDYDTLPPYFINIHLWPKSTNLLCWNCGNGVQGFPWFVPTARVKKSIYSIGAASENNDDTDNQNIYDTNDASNIEDAFTMFENSTDTVDVLPMYQNISRTKEVKAFKRHGCFCTEFCVNRYINRVKDPQIHNKWECEKLLILLCREITGKDVRDIPEADDKTIMMQYCGSKGITPQEYRERNENRRVILYERN